jgi:hypothetical protein
MDTQQVEILKQIGSEWQKNGMHRIYFNHLEDLYGLDCSYYKTGNISGATLNGELISNSEAKRIQARLAGKLWYDLADDKFYGRGLQQADFSILVAAIKTKMTEMTSEGAK